MRLSGRGPAPLSPDRRYDFDRTAERPSIQIASYQINEWDDYGHASWPEQETFVNGVIDGAGVRPVDPVYPGEWGFASEADRDRAWAAIALALTVDRDCLRVLEYSQQWLFHGSGVRIARLEPRQASTFDPAQHKMVPDGDPAVCATPSIDVAVFRALTTSGPASAAKPHRTGFGANQDGSLILEANTAVHEALRDVTAWLHILDRRGFEGRDAQEWRSPQAVAPVCAVAVTLAHLTTEISIVDDRTKTRLTQ
jgi:hypothetical protein